MTTPPQPIRMLLVEDNPADAELELRELKRAGLRLEHRVVDTEQAFRGELTAAVPEVILSDFSMPQFDGMQALALARELAPDVPFIFVSGTIGEEYAIRALKNGATDYVLKTNLLRLPAAVERALETARERAAARTLAGRLARLQRIREFVGEVNAAIVRIRDRQELFEAFCRIAIERGGFESARLVELDRETGLLRLAVTDSHDSLGPLVAQYNRDREGAPSLLAHAVRTGRAVISNNAANDERAQLREWYARQGVHSVACLPYGPKDKLSGILVLNAKERSFFDADEMQLLGELTDNLSFALELIEKQERLNYLAYYDALTGLPNHALFHDRLTRAIDAAKSSSAMMALMVIDLERFKAINDTLGRQTGDRVLQSVARRLHEAVGDLNRVARLGANTFAVMFPDIAAAEEAARRLEKDPAQFFGLPFEIGGREMRLAVKAGIAVYPADGPDADALFRNAEASLKRAKETGERCLFYTPQINAQVAEQLELERRLRKAVEHGELFLHFQPKYELANRRIVGLEALMRWQSPDGAVLVSPAKFVPVLEQTGLILEAGKQVLAAARRAHLDWRARGLNPPRIAVNVSALQLRRRSFVEEVLSALGSVGGVGSDGGGIDLEITESLLMSEVDESIRKLRKLRELGFLIALDDFGTGYSSLAYLSKLPLDALKIDRSFIHGMAEKADDTSIVTTIISLGQTLRLKVVAEGVESEQQAELLRRLRCDQAQGYLFSPPVPAGRIEELLKTL